VTLEKRKKILEKMIFIWVAHFSRKEQLIAETGLSCTYLDEKCNSYENPIATCTFLDKRATNSRPVACFSRKKCNA
jgi:hypothetical protein